LIHFSKLEFHNKEIWGKVSEECKDFVKQCLRNNPKERPSAAKLLEHEWIKKKDASCCLHEHKDE
jgi:serine/threonine protein kinase